MTFWQVPFLFPTISLLFNQDGELFAKDLKIWNINFFHCLDSLRQSAFLIHLNKFETFDILGIVMLSGRVSRFKLPSFPIWTNCFQLSLSLSQARPNISQLWSLKTRWSTFLSYIKMPFCCSKIEKCLVRRSKMGFRVKHRSSLPDDPGQTAVKVLEHTFLRYIIALCVCVYFKTNDASRQGKYVLASGSWKSWKSLMLNFETESHPLLLFFVSFWLCCVLACRDIEQDELEWFDWFLLMLISRLKVVGRAENPARPR